MGKKFYITDIPSDVTYGTLGDTSAGLGFSQGLIDIGHTVAVWIAAGDPNPFQHSGYVPIYPAADSLNADKYNTSVGHIQDTPDPATAVLAYPGLILEEIMSITVATDIYGGELSPQSTLDPAGWVVVKPVNGSYWNQRFWTYGTPFHSPRF